MTEKCLNCENLKSENAKLLRDLQSQTLENKNFKNSENDLKIQIKNLENEKVKIEKDFQNQIKILEDEKDIFGKNNLEKQIAINSHLAKIIQLEKEAESDRNKITELENKLKGFVTSAPYVCPKPINSVPISDSVTNFDKVKIEDCDDKTDDENEKNEKKKKFLKMKNQKLKNIFKNKSRFQKMREIFLVKIILKNKLQSILILLKSFSLKKNLKLIILKLLNQKIS